jgi:hypothetical protein
MSNKVYILQYTNLDDHDDQDVISVSSTHENAFEHLFKIVIPHIEGEIDIYNKNWFENLKDFIIIIYEAELDVIDILSPRLVFSIYNYKTHNNTYYYGFDTLYSYVITESVIEWLKNLKALPQDSNYELFAENI